MAFSGRVRRHESYHAWEHNIAFDKIVGALLQCSRVELDGRTGPRDESRHPDGHIAWGATWSGVVLRVDFNLSTTADGRFIDVVTAFEVHP